MKELVVREVAHRMGVSEQRVRVLLKQGRLAGRKVGRAWLVSGDTDLPARENRGRPVSAANAWALLALLGGEVPAWVDPSVCSRLRRRIRDRELVHVLKASEPRSAIYRGRVLLSDLPKVSQTFHLVPSGLSAKSSGLDIVLIGQALDAYVDAKTLRAIERRFRPDRGSSGPNVTLRVPTHPWILRRPGEAPQSVVAADLLADEDPRVARAAARLLEGIHDSDS